MVLRRTRLLLPALVVWVVSASFVARADWQFTRWGMSPEQVLAAAKGRAQKHSEEKPNNAGPRSSEVLAVGTYEAGEFKFSVHYEFKERRLVGVLLQLDNVERGSSLVESLMARYGTPMSSEKFAGGMMMKWLDAKERNTIEFYYDSSALFLLNYKGLSTAGL